MTSAEAIGTSAAVLSAAFFAGASHCFRKWADAPPPAAASGAEPPITFLRPLKRGSPGLREKLAAHAAALRPGDQLILGAEVGSAEAALGEEVQGAFPERDIAVVRCDGTSGTRQRVPLQVWNPKIAKLVQMMPRARHEHLVVADSEALLDRAFVEGWRAEWAASGAEVLTAGYRFAGARSWPQRLDAATLLVTLWPGIAVLRAAGPIRFTLGACFALRRADLAAVGGWEALGGHLAEDNLLGTSLTAAGRTIRLSRPVVALECDPLGWRDWWRHQRRMAVTYRAAQPWGYAGSIVTHGESWALALLATGHPWAVALFFGVWAGRVALARVIARRIGFELPGLPLAVLGASLAGSVGWVLSWGARGVWWGGQRWRVSFRGKMRGI